VLSTARPHGRVGRRGIRIAIAALLALMAIGCGAALGAGGGIAPPGTPELTDVICQDKCLGLREASAGSRVQLSGRNLDYVEQVRFDQKGGGRVTAEAQNASGASVEATVPEDAATGRPQVVDSMGVTADSPEELKISDAPTPTEDGGGGIANEGGRVADVSANPAKGFFMGQQAKATFVAQGSRSQDVRVDVVDRKGTAIRSLVGKDVEPGTPAQVRWNGKTEDGKVASNGEYEFEVRPMSGGDAQSAPFEQYDHIFPVRGKHQFWAGLGDGRGHQGVDVGANCGKRLVAARGGKVQAKAYHGAAGNYVVIDGKGTSVDYMYAHLQQPTKYKEGDKVKTGAGIGKVGETGNAQGCHLHFEMWDGDWYGGGKVMDPMPHLKRWDGWS
jgi:murein DD-endopeptidase MepM/ murein hydrolase activator NlpD